MNRVQWNDLVKTYAPPFGAFLQSWEWGEFQASLGRKVERVHRTSPNGVLMSQAVKMDLPFGQFYWYLPKGPLGTMSSTKMLDLLREELSDAMFLRIEPSEPSSLLQVPEVQPGTTLVIDLRPPRAELLKAMHSKTRYNIRLSERKGVSCKFVELDAFEDFLRLLSQTTKRDAFASHPDSYYKKMLDVLEKGDVKARLAMAFFEDRPLAANIVVDFQGTRTYLHGATSNLHRNVMSQYALHWYLMADAKQRGLHKFDFWGVASEEADDAHPWKGITRYKKSYGGSVQGMPGTYDFPMRHLWYSMYRSVKKIRSIR